ncbi:MAG: ABC transporter permease, partial [Gemmatimonadaceae bacterium]
MTVLPWRRYLRFWRPDVEDDVDEELRFHVDMREREYTAAGRTEIEAHAEALRRFGNVQAVRDTCYEIGHNREKLRTLTQFIQGIRNDALFAVRQLMRNRGFTIAAVLTLALGIGANGLVFGLVNAVLLKPLPAVRNPERLIAMNDYSVSYPSYRDFRDANPALSGLAAFSDRNTAVSNGHQTTISSVGVVSGNYFRVLGVKASIGRTLAPADDDGGAPAVAVLSASFARSFFPANESPLGRTIDLNGAPVTVIGVADPDFRGTELDSPEQLWITAHAWFALAPASYAGLSLEQRGWSWLRMIGRLNPGASINAASAALRVSAARQEAAFPRESKFLGRTVTNAPPVSARDGAISSVSHGTMVKTATIILAVVAIVLLIACANVSNLLLARATSRRGEIAVRMAIGAGRGRLIRQLLTETAVLAVIAATFGLIATLVATRAISHISVGGDISLAALGTHLDSRVIAYTIALALIASVIFGVAPALLGTSEKRTMISVKDGTPGAGRARSGLRRSLLVTQVALSLTLLIGAGLFTRSLQRALSSDPGFDGSQVATAGMDVGLIRRDSARAGEIYDAILRRLQQTPGVKFAALATSLPLDRGSDSEGFSLDDYIPPPGPDAGVEVDDVTPEFMQTFSIPLLRGRLFNDNDGPSAPHVAIINETMARRYWADREPIGKRILFGGDTVSIVGVVRDTKYHDLREPAQPFVYRVLGQRLSSTGLFPQNLVVRGAGNPTALIGLVRNTLHDVAPEVPVYDIATFEAHTGHVVLAQRLGSVVLGLFGILALVITAVGIYGVVSYGVTQRTREMGIRLALGAPTRSVLALILIDNLSMILAGLVIGILLSVALTRTVSGFLFG